MSMTCEVCILGGGMTGLAAGLTSGAAVYEAQEVPGGICSSYYVRPGTRDRLHQAPDDGEAYRFEIGGGHWIFGGDPIVVRFIKSITPVKSYARRSSIYFPDSDRMVPYPIQNQLRYLGPEVAARALSEMADPAITKQRVRTMADWLKASFGPTLCRMFFDPFHELYTAGLWREIAPQDAYKSPVDLALAIRGAFDDAPPVGYNVTFIYPQNGLNVLAQKMADRCNINYGKKAVKIDVASKEVHFEDGARVGFKTLLSTLPLNRMIDLTGLELDARPDPSPSVLVINIGAVKGPKCPPDHWLYIPTSRARFHRVGFYSNVDSSFLPGSATARGDRVSIYVEKAYPESQDPPEAELEDLANSVVRELQQWQWIQDTEVVDPTWIDVAYTWSWPESQWSRKAQKALEEHGIYQIGRYARWSFQGIADSISDGLMAGSALGRA